MWNNFSGAFLISKHLGQLLKVAAFAISHSTSCFLQRNRAMSFYKQFTELHIPDSYDETSEATSFIGLAGWLLVISACYAFRIELPTLVANSFSFFDLVLFSLFLLVILQILVKLNIKFSLGDRFAFIILLVPAVSAFASIIWSQDVGASVRSVVNYCESIIAFLLAVNIFERLTVKQIITRLASILFLLLSGTALSYIGIPGLDPLTLVPDESPEALEYLSSYYTRLSHPFIGLSNNYAGILSFLCILYLGCGAALKSRKSIVCFWISLLAVILTFSRGCLLSLATCLILYIIVSKDQIKLLPKLTAMFLLAVVILSFLLQGEFLNSHRDIIEQTSENRLSSENVSQRIEKFEIGLEMLSQAPILGYGAGMASHNWILYGGTHNTYLEQLLYYGIPLGTIVVISLLSLPWRFLRKLPCDTPESILRTSLGLGILSQLLIFLSQASNEGTLLKVWFYFSVGLGVALVNRLSRERTTFAVGS